MLGGSFFLVGMLVTWLTPLWLISVGAAAGVILLGVAYGIMFLCSRRLADIAYTTVREGVLLPIFYLAMALTLFAALGAVLIPQLPYRALLAAVARISQVGDHTTEITIPPTSLDYDLDSLDIRLGELRSLTAESDKNLLIGTNIPVSLAKSLMVKIPADGSFSWTRPPATDRDRQRETATPDMVLEWTATNVGNEPAKLRLFTSTDIAYPEVRVVPYTAIALVALFVVYLVLRLATPKISAIAVTTAKESMSQPLFYVALCVGVFSLLAFIFIPYNTFGEDVKMLKDSGLTLIMVLSIIVAVWSASVSVSEEVEGRTALTVLSKPVRRRQFILGKFLGILGPVVVLFVVLGTLFLLTVSYKVVYDAREVAKSEPNWQICYLEMIRIVPGLVLAFFETVVLAAISVAMSTRLPMLANLLVCASVYVLGHLVPMVVSSSVGKFEIVRFVGQFIATVLPVLDHFNIQAAVAAGAVVPMNYLGAAFAYCLLYTTIAMLLALAMFEDRDLA